MLGVCAHVAVCLSYVDILICAGLPTPGNLRAVRLCSNITVV